MNVILLPVTLFALLLAAVIVFASKKGLGPEIVLTFALLTSAFLAFIGMRQILSRHGTNDIRGAIIATVGIIAIVCSGVVYQRILKKGS